MPVEVSIVHARHAMISDAYSQVFFTLHNIHGYVAPYRISMSISQVSNYNYTPLIQIKQQSFLFDFICIMRYQQIDLYS